MNFEKYISVNSDVRFGKPCIQNTRIAVEDVLQWISSGQSIEEILQDFLQLKKEEIECCIEFSKQ